MTTIRLLAKKDQRQFRLIQLLINQPDIYTTYTDLAKQLDCSSRIIQSDIKSIEKRFHPSLSFDPSNLGGKPAAY